MFGLLSSSFLATRSPISFHIRQFFLINYCSCSPLIPLWYETPPEGLNILFCLSSRPGFLSFKASITLIGFIGKSQICAYAKLIKHYVMNPYAERLRKSVVFNLRYATLSDKWSHHNGRPKFLTEYLNWNILLCHKCNLFILCVDSDGLCVLVVSVSDCSLWGPGFDSRGYQNFCCGSGTGSTQPRKHKWGAIWNKT
jgi:hypothetical protein